MELGVSDGQDRSDNPRHQKTQAEAQAAAASVECVWGDSSGGCKEVLSIMNRHVAFTIVGGMLGVLAVLVGYWLSGLDFTRRGDVAVQCYCFSLLMAAGAASAGAAASYIE